VYLKLSKTKLINNMKKIFGLIILVNFLGFLGCKDEVPTFDPPTVTPPAASSVQINKSVDLSFAVTTAGGYKASTISQTGGTAVIKTQPAVDEKTGSVIVTFTASANAGAGSVTLTTTDNKDKTGSQTAVISISLDAPPTLTLSATTASGVPGAKVKVTATVAAPNGFATIAVTGATATPASPVAITAATKEIEITIPTTAVIGSTINAVFTTTDAKGLTSSAATLVITVTDPTVILEGTLASRTLTKGTAYLIKGTVIVPTGATLTVEAGVVVKGDKTTKGLLIIQPGGKLISNGTATEPIVFTSSQGPGERDRGDWGGISWTGNAFVNQAARPNAEGITGQAYGTVGGAASFAAGTGEDNGSMKFTRIEYAGIELTPNNETNSLTMGALGDATIIENVQASFGGDDSFEWFGGKVNGKRLISLSAWDDDFDSDFGWSGNVQWGIVVRNVSSADQSGSNAFESDNQGNGDAIAGVCDGTVKTGCTSGVFSNITVLGPRDIQSRTISNNFDNALHIRRRSNISIFNSFFSGWRKGLRIDDQGTLDNLTSGSAVHAYNVLSVPGTAGTATSATATDALFITGLSGGDATSVAAYWAANNNTSFNNITTSSAIVGVGVAENLYWGFESRTSLTYPSDPAFVLGAGVAGPNNLNGSANYTNAKLGAFFDKTITYKGAFGTTDWTDGWSEFRPLLKVY
jgi:hypothetical protein